jgi:hypothetical protein
MYDRNLEHEGESLNGDLRTKPSAFCPSRAPETITSVVLEAGVASIKGHELGPHPGEAKIFEFFDRAPPMR